MLYKKQKKKTKPFQWEPISKKSLNFIKNSNAWINIADGAVRSSKTISCSARWITYLANSPHDEFLMTGKTSKTLKRNVLNNFKKMLTTEQIEFKHYEYDGYIEIYDDELGDKTLWCIGLNDEKATDIVAGMTVGGWYADEISRCPRSAVEMCISRCSLPGSKMFWNTNPDSPYHFLFTNYINNQELIREETVKVWKFLLNDNLTLTQEYKDNLIRVNKKKSPIFYKRNILGEWVVAEGAVYPMFLESENTYIHHPQMSTINICCDYGVSTVTTFGVMGIQKNPNGNKYYLMEETYHDAEETQITQTDTQRCDTIVKLQNKHHLTKNNTLYLPHDAASLKTEAIQDPRIHMTIKTYTPNTYGDIEVIQNLIGERRFKIHESCTHSIIQAQTYSWDKKAQQRGEDTPLKVNDHCPDMWRGGILGPRNTGKKQIYHAPRRIQV